MPAASPTLETVATAIQSAIDAVNLAAGTVLVSDTKNESELLNLEEYKVAGTGVVDLWIVTCRGIEEQEGEATGESYAIYHMVCEYYNVREGDASWEKTGRQQVETIRDALNQSASIFRISSQIQLRTPETVRVESQGLGLVEDQLVFLAVVALDVEARRWA